MFAVVVLGPGRKYIVALFAENVPVSLGPAAMAAYESSADSATWCIVPASLPQTTWPWLFRMRIVCCQSAQRPTSTRFLS